MTFFFLFISSFETVFIPLRGGEKKIPEQNNRAKKKTTNECIEGIRRKNESNSGVEKIKTDRSANLTTHVFDQNERIDIKKIKLRKNK